MPGLAQQMQLDGTLELDPSKMPRYLHVADNKADCTIFVFSGLDVLFAGMARFEFGRLLRNLGDRCNVVFIRDIHRSLYHMAPEGSKDGLVYFEKKLQELMDDLGASVNIGLGSSAGGGAAFFFGSKCGLDHVIAFGPAFPASVYTGFLNQMKTYLNLKALFTDPRAYSEVLMVTIGAIATMMHLRRDFGKKNIWNILEVYRAAPQRPHATVFYGERCGPDCRTARILSEFPEVKLAPLPTGRHNTPEFLQERGELGGRLVEEIEAAIEGKRSR